MPRAYTEQQRKEALDLYAADGPAAASRATGIPGGTIRSWARRTSGVQRLRSEKTRAGTAAARLTWEQRRAELTLRLGEVAALLLEKAAAAEEAQEAKNLMLAIAIAVDKAQLLSGGATLREETVTDLDREIKALLLEMEAAEGEPSPASAGDAPAGPEPEPEQEAQEPEPEEEPAPRPPPAPPPTAPAPPDDSAVPWAPRRWG